MYLINADTGRLEQFRDDRTLPPFATLSHTWRSDEEEVTMQEYKKLEHTPNPEIEQRPGYLKIVATRRQAQKEREFLLEQAEKDYERLDRECRATVRLRQRKQYKEAARLRNPILAKPVYVWVDTVCIDKDSSTELNEAINSMFRWYRKAQMCFAYLEDFDASTTDNFEHRLSQVRWFRRGWTLQELIAPRTMDFFDQSWLCKGSPGAFGDKASLAPKLARITGIDKKVLTGRQRLGAVSVAKRMSWAANRRTTKDEDIAYCLLGIFDLSMNLCYGEGARAFVRLQEKIARTHDDQSLFAWEPDNARTCWLVDQPAVRPEAGLSVFASHPRQFLSTSNIRHWDSWGDAPTIGNKGVRFVVPLHRVDPRIIGGRYNDRHNNKSCRPQDTHLVPLNCTDGGDISYCPAIVVLHVTQDQFIRHPTAGLVWIKESYVDYKSAKLWPIHLCKSRHPGSRTALSPITWNEAILLLKASPGSQRGSPVPEGESFQEWARKMLKAPNGSVIGLAFDVQLTRRDVVTRHNTATHSLVETSVSVTVSERAACMLA